MTPQERIARLREEFAIADELGHANVVAGITARWLLDVAEAALRVAHLWRTGAVDIEHCGPGDDVSAIADRAFDALDDMAERLYGPDKAGSGKVRRQRGTR